MWFDLLTSLFYSIYKQYYLMQFVSDNPTIKLDFDETLYTPIRYQQFWIKWKSNLLLFM